MIEFRITCHVNRFVLVLAFWALLSSPSALVGAQQQKQQCSVVDENEIDPNLKEMIYDVGDGPQKFMAYVDPDVTSYYQIPGQEDDDSQPSPPASTKVTPKFNGLAGKFINMSNQYLTLMWESRPDDPNPASMRHYTPFSSGGSGTFPGHRFFFIKQDDPKRERLKMFIVENYPENIYYYDPYRVEGDPVQTEKNLKANLNKKERVQYDDWVRTLKFNDQYRNFTGRSYLANYLRDPPTHFMWRADYFGQQHWVTTRETHFDDHLPKLQDMDPIMTRGEKRQLKDTDPRIMADYRVPNQDVMNMTLKVLSCAPRVFEIPNFLSPSEVNHIVELAAGIDLKASSVGDVGSNGVGNKKTTDNNLKTRTSFNSWVPREQSPIIDAIYRRAGDLLRIDETLLRHRGKTEYPNLSSTKPICESLQLVHYGLTQEVSICYCDGTCAVC